MENDWQFNKWIDSVSLHQSQVHELLQNKEARFQSISQQAEGGLTTTEFEKMAAVLEEHDCICTACRFQRKGCSGGIHGGPNGPLYPPCADSEADEYLDKNLLAIVYRELQEEEEKHI